MQHNACAGHLHKAMASVCLSPILFNSKWLQQTRCSYCTPYNNCTSYVMAQESEKLRGHGGAQKTVMKIWLAGCFCSLALACPLVIREHSMILPCKDKNITVAILWTMFQKLAASRRAGLFMTESPLHILHRLLVK